MRYGGIMLVGCEMIIISNPTSASGIILKKKNALKI